MSLKDMISRWREGADARTRRKAAEERFKSPDELDFEQKDYEAYKDDVRTKELLPSMDDPPTSP
jgi:hypothetical protein